MAWKSLEKSINRKKTTPWCHGHQGFVTLPVSQTPGVARPWYPGNPRSKTPRYPGHRQITTPGVPDTRELQKPHAVTQFLR